MKSELNIEIHCKTISPLWAYFCVIRVCVIHTGITFQNHLDIIWCEKNVSVSDKELKRGTARNITKLMKMFKRKRKHMDY